MGTLGAKTSQWRPGHVPYLTDRHVAPLDTLSWFRANQYFLFLLNAATNYHNNRQSSARDNLGFLLLFEKKPNNLVLIFADCTSYAYISQMSFLNHPFISAISWRLVLLGEETGVPNIDLSKVTDKLYHIMFESTTAVVIDISKIWRYFYFH
jgi:hypothetical protein